jgi:hypothetical protein
MPIILARFVGFSRCEGPGNGTGKGKIHLICFWPFTDLKKL